MGFIEKHARTMTPKMFSYATEKLTAREKAALRRRRAPASLAP
jgi:hypothetical protein